MQAPSESSPDGLPNDHEVEQNKCSICNDRNGILYNIHEQLLSIIGNLIICDECKRKHKNNRIKLFFSLILLSIIFFISALVVNSKYSSTSLIAMIIFTVFAICLIWSIELGRKIVNWGNKPQILIDDIAKSLLQHGLRDGGKERLSKTQIRKEGLISFFLGAIVLLLISYIGLIYEAGSDPLSLVFGIILLLFMYHLFTSLLQCVTGLRTYTTRVILDSVWDNLNKKYQLETLASKPTFILISIGLIILMSLPLILIPSPSVRRQARLKQTAEAKFIEGLTPLIEKCRDQFKGPVNDKVIIWWLDETCRSGAESFIAKDRIGLISDSSFTLFLIAERNYSPGVGNEHVVADIYVIDLPKKIPRGIVTLSRDINTAGINPARAAGQESQIVPAVAEWINSLAIKR